MSTQVEITGLLNRLSEGDRSAEAELVPHIYMELHRLAARYLKNERAGHTLQPTALVNEAFIRLTTPPASGWAGRTHFFATSSHVMRKVLTDYARQRKAAKRGGANKRVELSDEMMVTGGGLEMVLALDEALDRLRIFAPRQAQVVEMRFFAGLSVEEIGDYMGIASRTVKRDWNVAKAWLTGELSRRADSA
ncbi:ECF-type sigma factor [Paludibaculum fermentans]|uniref:ECF-type sigma factor n=1 Tax=Paludibaculum fermentans TaxID=1473598 RepID=UPI003EC0DFEC